MLPSQMNHSLDGRTLKMTDESLRELWGKVDALMAKYNFVWKGNRWVKNQSSKERVNSNEM